jgi:hypothetical protein
VRIASRTQRELPFAPNSRRIWQIGIYKNCLNLVGNARADDPTTQSYSPVDIDVVTFLQWKVKDLLSGIGISNRELTLNRGRYVFVRTAFSDDGNLFACTTKQAKGDIHLRVYNIRFKGDFDTGYQDTRVVSPWNCRLSIEV